jgi:hypothetical protein
MQNGSDHREEAVTRQSSIAIVLPDRSVFDAQGFGLCPQFCDAHPPFVHTRTLRILGWHLPPLRRCPALCR